jgi:hypothetical protein
MTTRITTIGDGKSFISLEQLAALRSIVQTERAPTTSLKYKFYSTMDVIDGLRDHNWYPVKAQEQRVLKEGRLGYQRHMVRFRQEGTYLDKVGDLAPELILTNAHDGTTRYSIMAGFFKLACLNGLIVSEGSFGQINVLHLGRDQEEVIEASYKVIEEVPRLAKKISSYQKIELKPAEQIIFAESTLLLKYAKNDSKTSSEGLQFHIDDRTFDIPALLNPLRAGDVAPTLWNVFNRVQEKMTKGNRFERTVHTAQNGHLIHKEKVPGITGITENIRVNRGLWHLMEEMAKQKRAA